MMKSKVEKKEPFSTILDFGSPITNLNQKDIRQILKQGVVFTRSLLTKEQRSETKITTRGLLGCFQVYVQVGRKAIKRAKIVVSRTRGKPVIGRDWLANLDYKVAKAILKGEYTSAVNKISNEKTSEGIHRLGEKFSKAFSRKSKLKECKTGI